ncbi:MAG: hypothetical protein AB1414_05665 [bacterium]
MSKEAVYSNRSGIDKNMVTIHRRDAETQKKLKSIGYTLNSISNRPGPNVLCISIAAPIIFFCYLIYFHVFSVPLRLCGE